MRYPVRHFRWLAVPSMVVVSLIVTVTNAVADAPQLTVTAAHYAFNAHASNWTCDSQSELPPGTSCYSANPAGYTFAHHGHVVENPLLGKFVWLMDGGARDGGFATKVGDNLLTFESTHPQAPGKVYRSDSVETPSLAHLHWEPFSAFWQPSSAFSNPAQSAYYWFVNFTESGMLPTVTDNRLKVGESLNGTSNYTWRDVYHIERPNGQKTGAMHFLNRDDFIPHPTNPARWIGLVAWTRKTPADNNESGVMPVYIDTDRLVVGFQFKTDGWCEYPLGHKFDSWNPGVTCSPTGNTSSTVPGAFYKLDDIGKSNLSLANIGGKILVLYNIDGAAQNCGSDVQCMIDHAPCPPGQDTNLYVQRRSDSTWASGNRFFVRELALSTWDEASLGHTWVGNRKQILISSTVDKQFDLAPTDIGSSIFGHYDVDLRQFSDGSIYLYMGVKHSLCLPESSPALNSWDRFPKKESGNSFVWFRLTSG